MVRTTKREINNSKLTNLQSYTKILNKKIHPILKKIDLCSRARHQNSQTEIMSTKSLCLFEILMPIASNLSVVQMFPQINRLSTTPSEEMFSQSLRSF